MRSTNMAKNTEKCSPIAEISISVKICKSAMTHAHCLIVLKLDTLVQIFRPRNYCA